MFSFLNGINLGYGYKMNPLTLKISPDVRRPSFNPLIIHATEDVRECGRIVVAGAWGIYNASSGDIPVALISLFSLSLKVRRPKMAKKG